MRFVEELSTKEISEQLNVSQKTVQTLLGLAVNDLRVQMGSVLTLTIVFTLLRK